MRILFLGDVVGRSGREAVARHLPMLKETLRPEVVVVNAENAAAGHGITAKLADELFGLGIDCLTMGNHVWGQKELLTAIGKYPALVRPLNYPEGTPGKGAYLHRLPDGRQVLIVNAMARLFMEPVLDDPFAAMERLLAAHKAEIPVFVDFHGEATSEKMAFAHKFDGRVAVVVGTHTHVPTADGQILGGGTAFQSDAGMCGDYDSVVGMKKEIAIWRFTRKIPAYEKASPAEGEGTVCGVVVECADRGQQASRIAPVRVGGRLARCLPEV